MQAYLSMWKNYVNFKGRTTVKGYWLAVLFNFLVSLILSILVSFADVLSILALLYSLAGIIPGLALSIRRLHDINKSGWWVLINLVPLVGAIVLIVFFCLKSVDENNKYGEVTI
ncbi:MAG TPA: DUF805 domain-containing protein [Candidatus Hungatella pullicola]|nr:DUF805 domain-containing protein [Candidatus Hungatella pullicola]